jgi:hypothetical protein
VSDTPTPRPNAFAAMAEQYETAMRDARRECNEDYARATRTARAWRTFFWIMTVAAASPWIVLLWRARPQ